ncbi:hypothetical protein [Capnocytophaga catalasegens]|uniref:Uncharacterized protein n=1 Tax=Capnocytophaga catalasegens TaxID=1004260 RepID=A0AAV5B0K2_9FLAO|nr:hypothetical protein [Capnocytophaga catalasegens]GIZ16202.1 hypothetical protein RCZ03_22020 [Capnocytophaga catalasegens]GJM51632.1 hypothetical protein RCZ15_26050 [Capnocytophaga catalasegens]GJM54339.1 hypothetical protein RCZ16_26550 [Capnocytophaga catalasegens]
MGIFKKANNIYITVRDTYTSISGSSYEEAEEVIIEATNGDLELVSQKKVVMQGLGNEKSDDKNKKKQLLVTKVEGVSIIQGGKTYLFKAIVHSKEKIYASDLFDVRWMFKYKKEIKKDFSEEIKKDFSEKGHVYVNVQERSVRKEITFPLAEELLGVQKIKLYAYIKEPLEKVCLNIDFILPSGVFVWTEIKGTGHTFLTVHKNNRVVAYTYGRYDDVDFTQITGEGVLLKLSDNVAVDYIKEVLYKKSGKAYQIKDVTEENISSIFDTIWDNSNEKPNSKNAGKNTKEYGKVIDKYDVSGNNCTTVTCKALKEAGSNIFNFDSLLFGKRIYSYEENFVIPKSLQNFLEEQKETNKNISDATELMRKTFPNMKKVSEMGKTGIFGETSGSFGNSSGSSANSSSMDELSSGSGSASSGGVYSSSSN